MAFTPAFLDELRTRTSISAVVGRKLRLTRKGRDQWGLCPFHNEKTSSFKVDEEKGFYHCFGCGAHGNAIDFLINTENLPFPEAVERLAREAGMDIPVDSPEERERAQRQKTLYEVLERACAYFETQLRMPEGKRALSYLIGRGVSDDSIAKFRLGYAPDSGGALRAQLTREGIEDSLLIEAGLVIKPEDDRAPYDRFRGRLMFAINDRQGRVVAFGGRVLGDGEPKYLNSPETPVFHKGRMLYALDKARSAARQAGSILVAEGYMDVIALHQAGFGHAVAPLGTALTEDQIAELWKITPDPVLCLDGDTAGQRAMARAADRALPLIKPGLGLRFAILPAKDDPDSLIKRDGPAAMKAVLDGALPLSEILWRLAVGDPPPVTPEQKAAAWKRIKETLQKIADRDLNQLFYDDFKKRFWPEPVTQSAPHPRPRSPETGGRRGPWPREVIIRPVVARPPQGTPDAATRREQILLAVILNHPILLDRVEEKLGHIRFSVPKLDNLRREALKTLAGDPNLDSEALQNHLRQCGFSDLLDDILGGALYGHAFFARPDAGADTALTGWEETFTWLQKQNLEAEIEAIKKSIAEDPTPENLTRLNALQEELHRLDESHDLT